MYEKKEAANLIIEAGLKLVECGLIARTWGNISARISDTQFMITPSGRSYDSLTPDDIVVVNLEDYSYEGEIKPSGEKDLHGEVYRNRPEINFIIHTHQLYGTVYGSLGQDLSDLRCPATENYPAVSDEDIKEILGKKIPCGEYAISATKKLAIRMSEAVTDNPDCFGFFMKYHGVLCLGRDYEHAFLVSSLIEDITERKVEGRLRFVLEGKGNNEFVITEDIKNQFPGKTVMFISSPAIEAVSVKHEKLRPTIDDLAQIGGVTIRSIDAEDVLDGRLKSAMKKNNVAFIHGYGAIAVCDSVSDCEALGIVLHKNCMALLFEKVSGEPHYLGYFDAKYQRRVYVKKYSKLKNS